MKTQPRHFWKHDVILGAVRGGATAEWVAERFDARMGVWYQAGETVQGAVDMILFSLRQGAVEARAEREANGLRSMLKAAL